LISGAIHDSCWTMLAMTICCKMLGCESVDWITNLLLPLQAEIERRPYVLVSRNIDELNLIEVNASFLYLFQVFL